MITIYDDDDFFAAYRQYKRIIFVYALIAVIYAAGVIAIGATYISLPYGDSNQTLLKVIFGIITGIFVIFSYPYLGVKMRRSAAYYKLLKGASVGIKETNLAYFDRIDDWEVKDRVDVNVLVFKTWNGKKREWDERKQYIDAEKDVPEFKENEEVLTVTYGNVIISYAETGNFYYKPTGE